VREVKFGMVGVAAQHGLERGAVVVGQFARHQRGKARIVAQRQKLRAQPGSLAALPTACPAQSSPCSAPWRASVVSQVCPVNW
jgi:hypothetical protein